jgi:hypothetical protein
METSSHPLELKVKFLLPAFLMIGGLINVNISSSASLRLEGFTQIEVRAATVGNYAADPADLVFPAVDPDIISETLSDRQEQPVSFPETEEQSSEFPAAGSPTASPTPAPVFTNTPLGPTQSATETSAGFLPTIPAAVNTLVAPIAPVINTVESVLATDVPNILSTDIPDILDDLLPACIPLPLLPCP